MTKNTKFEIIPNENKELIYKELFNYRKVSMFACNTASSFQFTELINQKNEIYVDYGKSFSSFVEDKMKKIMVGYNTANVAQTKSFLFNKSNFNKLEILKGERTISSYKKNNPIIIHNVSYKMYKDDKNHWFIDVAILNKKRNLELGFNANKRFCFKINNLDKSVESIIERVTNEEYKQGAGQITYNEKKKKWFFGLAYTFEPKIEKSLDINKILGVDLGITNTATYSIYNMTTNTYDYLKYNECVISGDEIRHYRNTIDRKRRELSRATKWTSENKIGHGKKQRMSDVSKISDKCSRFANTYNHKISRYLVDEAIKHNCGVIQMENLSGFSKAQENSMLKNWSYFALQSKIKYKAEEAGIEFRLINPSYTSKRCSICGCIHDENRNCKKNQAEFKCVTCGKKMNADINASRNIALPNIEELIATQLKINNLTSKKKAV